MSGPLMLFLDRDFPGTWNILSLYMSVLECEYRSAVVCSATIQSLINNTSSTGVNHMMSLFVPEEVFKYQYENLLLKYWNEHKRMKCSVAVDCFETVLLQFYFDNSLYVGVLYSDFYNVDRDKFREGFYHNVLEKQKAYKVVHNTTLSAYNTPKYIYTSFDVNEIQFGDYVLSLDKERDEIVQ